MTTGWITECNIERSLYAPGYPGLAEAEVRMKIDGDPSELMTNATQKYKLVPVDSHWSESNVPLPQDRLSLVEPSEKLFGEDKGFGELDWWSIGGFFAVCTVLVFLLELT